MGGQDYTIRVGIATDAPSNFSQDTITLLQQKGYGVLHYDDEASCKKSVGDAKTHACIAFNGKQITIYLDESRMNLVYKISDDLSSVLNLQQDAIRHSLANDAIKRIEMTKETLKHEMVALADARDRMYVIRSNLTAAKAAGEAVSSEPVNISLRGLNGHQLGLAEKVHIAVKTSNDAITESIEVIHNLERECDDCSNKTIDDAYALRAHLELVQHNLTLLEQKSTKEQLAEAKFILDNAIADLDAVTQRFENESKARESIKISVRAASASGDIAAAELATVYSDLDATMKLLDGTRANASTLASPVDVTVESVAASEEKVAFTYPYLFVLVMMFMGLLLASTLVVTDKMSRASFRNFTTPTKDTFHIFSSFITAFIILLIEAGIILFASTIFVAEPLLLNTPATLVLICITIIVFSFIGMIIGYLSKTQETAMIASISVGSILLFVSNVISPIEGMLSFVQMIAKVNPYLVLSELLKRSMLFGITLPQVFSELLAITLFIIALFIVTMLIQRRAKKKYFRQEGSILAPHIPAPLAIAGHHVNNLVELLDVLDHMTRSEFESVVKADTNIISEWVAVELRNKSLAKKLRTTSKEKMMLQIDAYLKKHGKEVTSVHTQ
jgi:ABC-2 type transport system permease protein